MRKHGHRRQELPYSWEKLQLILDHLFNQLTVNLNNRIEAMHAASDSSNTNGAPLALWYGEQRIFVEHKWNKWAAMKHVNDSVRHKSLSQQQVHIHIMCWAFFYMEWGHENTPTTNTLPLISSNTKAVEAESPFSTCTVFTLLSIDRCSTSV